MTLLSQLQEKSEEVSRLEKQVADLQRAAQTRLQGRSSTVEQESSPEREQLQVRTLDVTWGLALKMMMIYT